MNALALLLMLLLAAAGAADAASRPLGGASSWAKKKHGGGGGDDDDAPPRPAPSPPGPDDDDAIAQMKACHAERGKSREACLAVPGGHCEFCKSGSALPLPDMCVHSLEAQLMPRALWECEKDGGDKIVRPAPNGDACEGLHQAACAASKGVCVWCVAGAVPSSCFTVEQAKALPPGVFDCGGLAPSAAAVF